MHISALVLPSLLHLYPTTSSSHICQELTQITSPYHVIMNFVRMLARNRNDDSRRVGGEHYRYNAEQEQLHRTYGPLFGDGHPPPPMAGHGNPKYEYIIGSAPQSVSTIQHRPVGTYGADYSSRPYRPTWVGGQPYPPTYQTYGGYPTYIRDGYCSQGYRGCRASHRSGGFRRRRNSAWLDPNPEVEFPESHGGSVQHERPLLLLRDRAHGTSTGAPSGSRRSH